MEMAARQKPRQPQS